MLTAPNALPSILPSNLRATSVIDLRSQLPVNPQYTWAAIGMRDIGDLTTIVFHHDAWPKEVSKRFTNVQLAQEIARDHIASKKNRATGDAGFPYDAWIRGGIIYICNDLLPIKWGVASNNSYTVHICVSGDYANGDALTDADRNAMLAAYAMYKAAMPAFQAVKGHREVNPSQCPGYDMNRVRADIAALELHMAVTDTPNDRLARAVKVASRVDDLYKIASKAGQNQDEAIRKLLVIEQAMVEAGILKV